MRILLRPPTVVPTVSAQGAEPATTAPLAPFPSTARPVPGAQHPLAALWSSLGRPSAASAVILGASLLLTGCSTIPDPLPGGVMPNITLTKSWSQGGQGNCVTVASIKAAQTIFPELAGPQGIFRQVQETGQGYEIEMRDGFLCQVTHAEVKQAEANSGFRIWSQKKSQNALLLYACSAKRAQLQGNDGIEPEQMTFARALQTLNDGEQVLNGEAFARLGLAGCTRFISPQDAKKYPAVVVANDTHAWFVTGGYGDNYGVIRPLGAEGWDGHTAVALLAP